MRHSSKVARIVGFLTATVMALFLVPTAPAHAGSTWEHNVVYVENHAPGWPVRQAAEKLDNGLDVDLRVVSICPEGAQCIKIYSRGGLSGTRIGLTRKWTISGRTSRSEIYLDNTWRRIASRKMERALINHEIGHALGMEHRGGKRSVMNSHIGKKTKDKFSKSERRVLNRRY